MMSRRRDAVLPRHLAALRARVDEHRPSGDGRAWIVRSLDATRPALRSPGEADVALRVVNREAAQLRMQIDGARLRLETERATAGQGGRDATLADRADRSADCLPRLEREHGITLAALRDGADIEASRILRDAQDEASATRAAIAAMCYGGPAIDDERDRGRSL